MIMIINGIIFQNFNVLYSFDTDKMLTNLIDSTFKIYHKFEYSLPLLSIPAYWNSLLPCSSNFTPTSKNWFSLRQTKLSYYDDIPPAVQNAIKYCIHAVII